MLSSKRCSRCGQTKDLVHFSKRTSAKDGLQSHCKDCGKARGREHYEQNTEDYLERNRTRRDVLRGRYYAWLSERACVDCGETDPVVLDCDHVRGTKVSNVTRMIADIRSWTLIETELQKCDVRCANCHRRRTAHIGGFRPKTLA